MTVYTLFEGSDQPAVIGIYSSYEKAAQVRLVAQRKFRSAYFIFDHEVDFVPSWIRSELPPEEATDDGR